MGHRKLKILAWPFLSVLLIVTAARPLSAQKTDYLTLMMTLLFDGKTLDGWTVRGEGTKGTGAGTGAYSEVS